MCIIAWVIVTVMLLVLHVPHAATLGLIAGITRAVPVIGPLLGAIPLALVCLLTTGSIPVTGALLIGFVLMHFVESKVLLPKIIGHEVDLHPVSLIVVLLIGLEFFGFLGVFLAVPFAAVGKILLIEWQLAALNRASEKEAAAERELGPELEFHQGREASGLATFE
jgi:predicted PurR-regulated permease PerM